MASPEGLQPAVTALIAKPEPPAVGSIADPAIGFTEDAGAEGSDDVVPTQFVATHVELPNTPQLIPSVRRWLCL
jgi:hypothetical protein